MTSGRDGKQMDPPASLTRCLQLRGAGRTQAAQVQDMHLQLTFRGGVLGSERHLHAFNEAEEHVGLHGALVGLVQHDHLPPHSSLSTRQAGPRSH